LRDLILVTTPMRAFREEIPDLDPSGPYPLRLSPVGVLRDLILVTTPMRAFREEIPDLDPSGPYPLRLTPKRHPRAA
jgi:hypothetical protein